MPDMIAPNVLQTEISKLLNDKDTSEWIKSLESESTKRNYPRHVAEYLLYRKITISELIELFKEKHVEESKRLQEFVNKLLSDGRSPGYVANYVAGIRSRLGSDEIKIIRRIKIPNMHDRPTIENESIPTKDQIILLLEHANLRAKCCIALIAFLGIRFKAMAGLRVSDFPEMQVSDKVTFTKTPTIVNIRKSLSKNKKPYQTFLIAFGCNILKHWLEFRIRQGEKLTLDSYILPVDTSKESFNKKGASLSKVIDRVLGKLNDKSRPYSLKNFFATALLNSGIPQNYQSFFMGHNGPMQLTYSLRRQLPQEQIEEMRKIFKEKIEPHFIPIEASSDIQVKTAFRKMAKEIGLEVKDDASLDETISVIAKVYSAGKADIMKRTSSTKQTRIQEDELDKYLEQGWELVTTLPSGSIIVKQT